MLGESAIVRLRSRDVRRSEGCLHTCSTKGTVQAAFLVSATFAGRSPLGAHASSASTPVRRRLPMAAAPAAMAGLAAAFALGNAPAASAATVDASGLHSAATAATTAVPQAGAFAELLVSVTGQPATGPVIRLDADQIAALQPKGKHHRTPQAKYVVKAGDTLASIAQRVYHSSHYWTVLYWANHGQIKYANEIQAGQVLTVPAKPAKIPGAPTSLAAAPAPVTSTVNSGESDSTASTAPAA